MTPEDGSGASYTIRYTLGREDAPNVATYAFRCRICGEEFDISRPMSERATLDREPPPCPRCGKTEVAIVPAMFTAIKDWRTT